VRLEDPTAIWISLQFRNFVIIFLESEKLGLYFWT